MSQCTCPYTDPKAWFYYVGTPEPSSVQEPDPDCQEYSKSPIPLDKWAACYVLEGEVVEEPTVTPDAIKAATKAFIEEGTLVPALNAAAPYMLAGKIEWGIFRVSDGVDCDPHEDRLYPSQESAQDAVNADYHQPDNWEVRGRSVGQWNTNQRRSQT